MVLPIVIIEENMRKTMIYKCPKYYEKLVVARSTMILCEIDPVMDCEEALKCPNCGAEYLESALKVLTMTKTQEVDE